MKRTKLFSGVFALLIAASFLLAACAPAAVAPTPEVVTDVTAATTDFVAANHDFVAPVLQTEEEGSSLAVGVWMSLLSVVVAGGTYLLSSRLTNSRPARIGISTLCFITILGSSAVSASYVTVDATQRAVIVRQGEVVGDIGPGGHFIFPYAEKAVKFSATEFTFITVSNPFTRGSEQYRTYTMPFTSSDNVKGEIRFVAQLQLDPHRVQNLYAGYGTLENAIIQVLKSPSLTYIRDVLRGLTAEEIILSIDSYNEDVSTKLKEDMKESGLILISFAFSYPDFGAWQTARNDTATAVENKKKAEAEAKVFQEEQQSRLYEAQTNADITAETAQAAANAAITAAQGEAEVTRLTADAAAYAKIAEATAQAKANQLVAASITDELIEYNKWLTWDGALPTFQLTTSGEGTPDLLLEVPTPAPQ